ncbi:MAG TPA: subclass B3 metallo-beta-lactamase [Pyrinomonadaceae bacterium]
MNFRSLVLITIFLFASTVFGQLSETEQSWNQPVEPFKIAWNIYYVGASDVTSYLITTPKGHILLDSGLKETVPLIKASVEKLGFKLSEIKYLINSHAHYDHAGGLAELKRLTGAQLLISKGDAGLLARGGKDDPNFGNRFLFEPTAADKTFSDGWKLKFGGTTLRANVTPGHTKGCTTWTMTVKEGSRFLNAIFVCSTTAPGFTLVGNGKYPEIVKDFESTFKRIKAIKVDIFLSSHASAFGLAAKAEKLRSGASPNPFIDPEGYRQYVESTEKAFRQRLAEQSQPK